MVDLGAFEWTFLARFVLAFALGTLIGLERESARSEHTYRVSAGVRTYTLICLFGFACGILQYFGFSFAFPVGLLALTALVVVTYLSKTQEEHFGWTSEVMSLLTFVIGALCMLQDMKIPVTVGIISTILLSEKAHIEDRVENLEKSEFLAALRLLVVTFIIFPALPNQNFTEFNINPASVWMIVIMVSSLGFAGYFLIKRLGNSVGLWLSGMIGGIVSSTAVSVAVGRIAQQVPGQSKNALRATLLASSVMYVRVLVLIAFLNLEFSRALWMKLMVLAGFGMILALFSVPSEKSTVRGAVKSLQNPFEIKPALIFAVLFVTLSVATELAKRFFGDAGLFGLSFLSGMVDVDPFILSMVHNAAGIQRSIVSATMIALMTNTLMKGIYFAVLAKKIRGEAVLKYTLWALLHLPFMFV